MPALPSTTITIAIDYPYSRTYAFLSDPRTFPQWASGLGSGLTATADPQTFVAQTPRGPMPVRFTAPNPFGVLDHYVQPAGAPEVHVPMRLLPNGDACEISLTLFRQPSMSDAQFAADADWVRRDLASLKALLESRPAVDG